MNYANKEVISAALDGERVDVEILRRALADEEGRETLASFLLLRAEVASADVGSIRPLHQVNLETSHLGQIKDVAPPAPAKAPRSLHGYWLQTGSRIRFAVAASLAILAIASSFWLGYAWKSSGAAGFEGQIGNAARPEVVADSGAQHAKTAPAPPEPTRVLKFEVGTDWVPERGAGSWYQRRD